MRAVLQWAKALAMVCGIGEAAVDAMMQKAYAARRTGLIGLGELNRALLSGPDR